VKWFREAADRGHAQAQCSLGFRYSKGKGLAQDYAEAVKWYRKAAEQGNAMGQRNLGVCYSEGRGVEQDFVEAYKWFSLAAAQEEEDSKSAKLAVARRMTPEQIAKAVRLAREFKPSSAPEPGALAPSR
jgi:uncharacterized protein